MTKLGTKVKDTVTGFTGTATARCEYLHGAARVQIEAESGERWVEETRVEGVDQATGSAS